MKKLIVVAIAAIAMFASSAYAADWDFYGSARIWTFSTDTEIIDSAAASTRNTNWELSPYSRIGANVKVSDELSGRFEYGASGGNANIRLLYGEWNFGAGSLVVGQDYEPIYLAYSGQVYGGDGLGGTGDAYNGRSGQLKLKFGEFQIALLEPFANGDGAYTLGTSQEVTLPKIQARYTMRFDAGSVRVVGGYNTYDEKIAGQDISIDSYVLGAGADFSFGAFRLAGSFAFGQNSAALIAIDVDSRDTSAAAYDGMARVNGAGTGVDDADTMGYNLIVGYTINDMLSLEAGYGYIEESLDNRATDNEACSYYIQMPITLAPGVTVTPEVGVYDYEEALEEDTTYFGAHWQINF